MIPIVIRTKDRPIYLETTLRSLLASDLPEGVEIVVVDDHSTTPLAQDFLYTSKRLEVTEPYKWPQDQYWKEKTGSVPDINYLTGIHGSGIKVVKPDTWKGDRGCLYWTINYTMEAYNKPDFVIILEDDLIFHQDWYKATIAAYEEAKMDCKNGPNGNTIGLVSAYDRKPSRLVISEKKMCWRSLIKFENGNWGCGDGIGGVMYLLTKELYLRIKDIVDAKMSPHTKCGDTALQGLCASHDCSILTTSPSYIQHIGIDSTIWVNKGWRHSRNFLGTTVPSSAQWGRNE